MVPLILQKTLASQELSTLSHLSEVRLLSDILQEFGNGRSKKPEWQDILGIYKAPWSAEVVGVEMKCATAIFPEVLELKYVARLQQQTTSQS